MLRLQKIIFEILSIVSRRVINLEENIYGGYAYSCRYNDNGGGIGLPEYIFKIRCAYYEKDESEIIEINLEKNKIVISDIEIVIATLQKEFSHPYVFPKTARPVFNKIYELLEKNGYTYTVNKKKKIRVHSRQP